MKREGVETVLNRSKEVSSHAVLEEAGIAFDPTTQHLDLTKDEKRRTTALMLAIQAYDNIIIKDAEMYIAIRRERGSDEGSQIQPATMNAMVQAAISFDLFLSGAYSKPLIVAAPDTESK